MHCTANCTLVFVVNDDPKRAEVFLKREAVTQAGDDQRRKFRGAVLLR
jgi:hypothetical protein